MNVSSVYVFISNYVFVFVPIPLFVIIFSSFLDVFFINFNETIFDKSPPKAHAFLFDILVYLEAIHNHVVCGTRMCIVNEYFNEMIVQEIYVVRVFHFCK